jgi:hypothetical protein
VESIEITNTRGHRHVVRYEPGDEASVLDELIAQASGPAATLNWFDAARLSHEIGVRLARELKASALEP